MLRGNPPQWTYLTVEQSLFKVREVVSKPDATHATWTVAPRTTDLTGADLFQSTRPVRGAWCLTSITLSGLATIMMAAFV